MTDILTGTPPDLTYLHPLVRQAWTVVWVIASGTLVMIIGWMGLSLIVCRAPGPPADGMAGDGAPPRSRPRGRCLVIVVVRTGPRRGRRRIRLSSQPR